MGVRGQGPGLGLVRWRQRRPLLRTQPRSPMGGGVVGSPEASPHLRVSVRGAALGLGVGVGRKVTLTLEGRSPNPGGAVSSPSSVGGSRMEGRRRLWPSAPSVAGSSDGRLDVVVVGSREGRRL